MSHLAFLCLSIYFFNSFLSFTLRKKIHAPQIARLLSSLYSSSRSHPAHSITFLLSGGGKINYAGTKRWLEEHLDMDTTSDLLANVDFVLCLDSVGNANPLKLHVSKPPKEGSPGEVFLRHLNSVSKEVFKINNVD